MSLSDTIITGRRTAAPRILLYGTEGVGKSTLGSQMPSPVFIDLEDGLAGIDTSAFPTARNYREAVGQLESLVREDHGYKSVVIDSADWLERYIWDEICRESGAKSIEKAEGGYGRGYVLALSQWREVVGLLERLRLGKRMCVMVIAHSKVETFHDPEAGDYDRFSPRLNKHASALLTEWADAVLFATRRMVVGADGRATVVKRPDGDRVLKTVGTPSVVAKNRYGMSPELPLSWQAVFDAILASGRNCDSPSADAQA